MDKNRMQKLAGINEGTIFKNGEFKLNRHHRYQLRADREGDMYFDEEGEYCYADEVAKLEELANEMYGIINSIMSGLEKADRNYTPFKLTQANIRDMKSLLKNAKSL